MRISKQVTMCKACGGSYYKPFWEPMFLARLAWNEFHEAECGSPENHEVAALWRAWERERIAIFIERLAKTWKKPAGAFSYPKELLSLASQIRENDVELTDCEAGR